MKSRICILDYGSGNINSILQAFKNIDVETSLASNIMTLRKYEFTHIILPGVGKFDVCKTQLEKSGLVEGLNEIVSSGRIPILGICIGMHLLGSSSAEGVLQGLNYIPGTINHLSELGAAPCPHMGWNNVSYSANECTLKLPKNNNYYYFIHSYYFQPKNKAHEMGISYYGDYFCSSVSKDNIFGVQFHPEKSHNHGLHLLKKFSIYKC